MHITAFVHGLPAGPTTIRLPRVPAEGQMLLVGGYSLLIKVVEWVADADHINVYLGPR